MHVVDAQAPLVHPAADQAALQPWRLAQGEPAQTLTATASPCHCADAGIRTIDMLEQRIGLWRLGMRGQKLFVSVRLLCLLVLFFLCEGATQFLTQARERRSIAPLSVTEQETVRTRLVRCGAIEFGEHIAGLVIAPKLREIPRMLHPRTSIPFAVSRHLDQGPFTTVVVAGLVSFACTRERIIVQ